MPRAPFYTLAIVSILILIKCTSQAQTDPDCITPVQSCAYDTGGGNIALIPPKPPGPNCQSSGPLCCITPAQNNHCIPPGASNEICLTCLLAKVLQAETGQPINLPNGNTYVSQTDISVPGLAGGLMLSRTWNSKLPTVQSAYPGMFGVGWRSNFESRLIFNSPDYYLKFSQSDGSVWSYGVGTVGSNLVYKAAAPANEMSTITTGNSYYTYVAQNGEKKLFDNSTGNLLSFSDRNGNTTQLTYDSSNRLSTVTDAASRHLYFNYLSPTSNLVGSVTSDVGITLSYSYDAQGRLIKVTKPDNTTVNFQYDAQSRITAVTDSDGKILESHTYDSSGRGLTSSRANGVDSVTVSY